MGYMYSNNSDNFKTLISNGEKFTFSSNRGTVELEPHDQVIQSDECNCTNSELNILVR